MISNFKGSGVWQWADGSINFQTGCEHGCLVCYAKEMSVRYKQSTKDNWETARIRQADVNRKKCKYKNTVIMFPSSHDITPNNINEAVIVLRKILEANNDVLIVSKPHFDCIKRICDEFGDSKDRILFRFTIGSYDNSVLKFWEPNAPDLKERMKSLKYAFANGYETSVSCEPMMDNRVDKVIVAVRPYVTETIWIGKVKDMWSRLRRNTKMTKELRTKAKQLEQWQSDPNILQLYAKYKNDPMIRWKESIEKVVGIAKKKIKKLHN